MLKENKEESGNISKLATPVLIFLLLLAAFWGGSLYTKFRNSETGQNQEPAVDLAARPTSTPGSSQPEQGEEDSLGVQSRIKIEESAIVKGSAEAGVVIVEFSDPSCPYCAAAAGGNQQVIESLKSRIPGWEAPLPQIEKEYLEKGLVRLVFHYFPGHGAGMEAMKIIWCAAEQGKGWEMKKVVYANQDEVGNKAALQVLSQGVDLNRSEFDRCLEKDFSAKESEEASLGREMGVSGTPTFFINGQMLVGAQPYQSFKSIIDSELEKS
ncbi:MAG: thioredoxin domain-containing protein [Candidatus Pacebacteria bacterium]|nr:thioredoxin domain-containing protein [Candidatus Paceibacterota bacterium]